jgi:hypothetical protein
LRTLAKTNDRNLFTVTTIIHVKIIRFAYLLFLSGLVVGLTMASPSLATITPHGTKSSTTEAVKGTPTICSKLSMTNL